MAQDILGPTWSISAHGSSVLTDNNTIKDKFIILKNALDSDLKEIGAGVLSKVLSNKITEIVLQIQKIRNISAPKANENSQAAPRMLKLVLTDGESYISAVEKSPITSISREKTSPGTKILIKNAKIISGFLILDNENCQLLGGKVPALHEKWELAKSIRHHTRQNVSVDGPPAWVNFGTKILGNVPPNKTFKSLDTKDKEAENKENSKFDVERQNAIAEASSGAVKKVFGGGSMQTTSLNHKKAVEQNFNRKEKRFERNSMKNADFEQEIDDRPQKSERVSLFDFLEDKLPAKPATPVVETNYYKQNTNSFSRQNDQNYNRDYNNKPSYKNNYEQNDHKNNISFNNGVTKSYQNYNQNNANRGNSANYYNKPYPNQKNERSYNNAAPKTEYSGPRNHYPETKDYSKTGPKNFPKPQSQKNYFNEPKNDVTKPAPKLSEEVDKLANNLNKISVNNEFATRSLRQHLNLAPTSSNSKKENADMKVGDECLAKYWEDGKVYNANITAVTDKTYVVKFKGYGNIEEVLKSDCQPFWNKNNRQRNEGNPNTIEFKRRSFGKQ